MMNQVLEEDTFISASEEEAIEVQYLLVEPQNDHASVDGMLCFHKENLEMCMETEDAHNRLGEPILSAAGKGDDIVELKVFNEMPQEVEAENLQVANGAFITCEDYLIDDGFAESVTNMDHDSHLGNSGSVIHISGFSCGDNSVKVSDLSTAIIPMSECQNNLLNKTKCELRDNFKCNCDVEASVVAKWPNFSTASELQIVEKVEDVSTSRSVIFDKIEKDSAVPTGLKKIDKEVDTLGLTSGGMSRSSLILESNEVRTIGQDLVKIESFHVQDVINESCAQDSNFSTPVTQKRLRKPTRRFIDESSDPNSRYCWKRREISTSVSASKFMGVRCVKHHQLRSKETTLSSNKSSFSKAIQVPFGSQGQKECQKNHSPATKLIDDFSKEVCAPIKMSVEDGGPRKHHRLWTLSEVRKLIDGVSHYGVGRWAQIKSLLFSSSAHRTPVDLKDKWRNLIKASCAEEVSQKEMQNERRRNQPWRPLPRSMLRRVSELANIYPYPREEKTKLSQDQQVSSPTLLAKSKGSPLCPSGRRQK